MSISNWTDNASRLENQVNQGTGLRMYVIRNLECNDFHTDYNKYSLGYVDMNNQIHIAAIDKDTLDFLKDTSNKKKFKEKIFMHYCPDGTRLLLSYDQKTGNAKELPMREFDELYDGDINI